MAKHCCTLVAVINQTYTSMRHFTLIAAVLLVATSLTAFRTLDQAPTSEPVSIESMLPTSWVAAGLTAEEARLAPPCSPRAIIGSDAALKACVRAAFEPGCDVQVDANVLGTCATGDFNVQLLLSKVCATGTTLVATVNVCGCDLDSWTCE